MAGIKRFCVYEIIDPRSGLSFWVGVARIEVWRTQARTLDNSDAKTSWIKTIRAEGMEPELRAIGYFGTLKEALRVKYRLCRESGQAFRGLAKGLKMSDITPGSGNQRRCFARHKGVLSTATKPLARRKKKFHERSVPAAKNAAMAG